MDEHNDFNEEMLLKEEERMVAYALVKEREVEVSSELLWEKLIDCFGDIFVFNVICMG